MDNILFFLTPKAMCAHLMADDTLRQALARMESARYAALPILNKKGEYCGTLTEGDVLWAPPYTHGPVGDTDVEYARCSSFLFKPNAAYTM